MHWLLPKLQSRFMLCRETKDEDYHLLQDKQLNDISVFEIFLGDEFRSFMFRCGVDVYSVSLQRYQSDVLNVTDLWTT
jgi:hypothetical protein